MSTKMMAIVWPLQMPPSPKAVLVSLADNANDEGHCFPSISTMCERTCLGRTAVIDAVKWLEQHQAIRADRSNGRHTTYTLTPEAFTNQSAKRTGSPSLDEPDQSASRTGPSLVEPANPSATRTSPPPEPVRETDGTSPPAGRDQSARRTLTVKEPSRNRQRESAPERPDEVPEQAWSDWLLVRKGKRAVLTATALDGVRSEARKAGIGLGDAIRICAERSWVGFRADWDWRSSAAVQRRTPTAADERHTYLAGLPDPRREPPNDPRTIDVDAHEAPAPRLALSRG